MDASDRRSLIETETFRALLLINGGGAVALLAVLASIFDKDRYTSLSFAMLAGLAILMFGLACAVIHNHLRAKAAAGGGAEQTPRKSMLGISLRMPSVVGLATLCLWLSIASFVAAGSYIAYRGLSNLAELQAQKNPPTAAPARRR